LRYRDSSGCICSSLVAVRGSRPQGSRPCLRWSRATS
jgi:hypothetical protein